MRKETRVKLYLDSEDVRKAIEYWLLNEKGIEDEDALENAKYTGLGMVNIEYEESEEE